MAPRARAGSVCTSPETGRVLAILHTAIGFEVIEPSRQSAVALAYIVPTHRKAVRRKR